MSPERARDLLHEHTGVRGLPSEVRAILAACAEERKAVLTEAVMVADECGFDDSIIVYLIDRGGAHDPT